MFTSNSSLHHESRQNQFVIIVTVIFFIAIFFMSAEPHTFDIPNPFGLPLAMSQAWLYSFGFIYAVAIRVKRGVVFPWTQGAGIVWVIGLLLASVYSLRPDEAFPQAISIALYLVAGYGIWKASCSDKLLKVALILISIVGIGWSIFIIDVFHIHGFLPHQYRAYLGFRGSYNHAAYGLLIVNGAVATMALFSKKRGTAYSIVVSIILSAAFFTVIISQSRGSFLALAVSCSYIIMRSDTIKGRGRTILKAAWVVVTVIFLIWTVKEISRMDQSITNRFNITNQEYQKRSTAGRIEMLKKGLILIARNPLGIGGNNVRYSSIEGSEYLKVEGYLLHNQYLAMIAEGGWVVIFTLYVLMRKTIVVPYKLKWHNPARLGIFCCWLNCSISALFTEIIGNYYMLMLFLVSAAIALENKARVEEVQYKTPQILANWENREDSP